MTRRLVEPAAGCATWGDVLRLRRLLARWRRVAAVVPSALDGEELADPLRSRERERDPRCGEASPGSPSCHRQRSRL